MKKALNFSAYKKLQKLSLNDTNRWINALYAQAFDDGKRTLTAECVATLTEDTLMDILLSVKGIGENRARQVVDKIIEGGITYGDETGRNNETN
jgi:hypothetical protein